MSGKSTEATDVSSLPPVQQMILDVLGARFRLGENCWTFSTRLGPALSKLEGHGLIGYKSGVTEKTYLASGLTDIGRDEVLMEDYPSATVAKKNVIRIRTDSGFEHKMRVVHVEQYMILLAELED